MLLEHQVTFPDVLGCYATYTLLSQICFFVRPGSTLCWGWQHIKHLWERRNLVRFCGRFEFLFSLSQPFWTQTICLCGDFALQNVLYTQSLKCEMYSLILSRPGHSWYKQLWCRSFNCLQETNNTINFQKNAEYVKKIYFQNCLFHSILTLCRRWDIFVDF